MGPVWKKAPHVVNRGFAPSRRFTSNRGFAPSRLFTVNQGFAPSRLFTSNRGFAPSRLFPVKQGFAPSGLYYVQLAHPGILNKHHAQTWLYRVTEGKYMPAVPKPDTSTRHGVLRHPMEPLSKCVAREYPFSVSFLHTWRLEMPHLIYAYAYCNRKARDALFYCLHSYISLYILSSVRT